MTRARATGSLKIATPGALKDSMATGVTKVTDGQNRYVSRLTIRSLMTASSICPLRTISNRLSTQTLAETFQIGTTQLLPCLVMMRL